jgi:hypothetical protein
MHSDVVAAGVDACLVNTLALTMINQDYDVNWLVYLCLSHHVNNAGDKAKFVVLSQSWMLLQKIFTHSDKGKVIWERVSGIAWKTYSSTMWFNKFEVEQFLMKLFPDSPKVLSQFISGLDSGSSFIETPTQQPLGTSISNQVRKLLGSANDDCLWSVRVDLSVVVVKARHLAGFPNPQETKPYAPLSLKVE